MFEVNQSTIDKTTKCDRAFACLTESGHPSCQVCDIVNKEVIFIESPKRYCNYQLQFAGKYVCTCPARKEIYNTCHI